MYAIIQMKINQTLHLPVFLGHQQFGILPLHSIFQRFPLYLALTQTVITQDALLDHIKSVCYQD